MAKQTELPLDCALSRRRARYRVFTWDCEKGWTPQRGVRVGPYSKWGLRKALRALRDMGYEARRGDPSVLVEADDWLDADRKKIPAQIARERR